MINLASGSHVVGGTVFVLIVAFILIIAGGANGPKR